MPNALIGETSPYLLQHACNPVEWQPWSEEAFARAKAEDKLVFLSVGYSTCHWCHVMEHESFENEAIAVLMNRHFINVKVDREERPDVDATYMAFVQATTGQGGWPMSVWLTPEGKPVVGGTYFPPEDRHGRAGFSRLCEEIGKLWKDDRAKMESSAEKVMIHLRAEADVGAVMQGLPDTRVFGDFIDRCEAMFDPQEGGWGGAPKFPRPVVPRLLLQLSERFGPESEEGAACLQMVERTLDAMQAGGMNDQLGGGFHRYSVDRYWHVPHYEKMLYDQGQLASLYLDAWQATGKDSYRETAEDIFRYVLDEMTDEGGAFHAAEDADSLPEADAAKKREGAFWTWEADRIFDLLDAKSALIFCAAYGVQAEGNARSESDPHEELVGQNTLYRALAPESLATRFGMTVEEIRESLGQSRRVLLAARKQRPMPHRDDKIVTAWNALMIGALARGARVLDRSDLLDAAKKAAAFLWENLWDGRRLFRSYRQRNSGIAAFAADYAFLIAAFIDLHSADGDAIHLDRALELQAAMDGEHWDGERGGYVMKAELAGQPLLVMREDYDGAEPSPGHVAAENLLKLSMLTGRTEFAGQAEIILRAEARVAARQGFAVPVLLSACDLHDRGVMKIERQGDAAPELEAALRSTYLPRAVFSRSEGPGQVIVCEGRVCLPPVRSLEEWRVRS
ncbi:thioredoxin domain-containing protein [Luteolibacter ambystomatis]|uniref:Thioredoxin domain-containing protein n=1 Tax=Luteolibacter ambystomatis TaxID=2824561 RepID=A0A975IZC1_9BACT|nr:thioredoxin domain-containing protein [Luteolibacter ambystomatis]QUE51137.1 thioredoxin domain-containing protein [Luteolibacter ambystomatis]